MSKKKYFCALGCGCFDTNAELQKHIYESHGGEVYDEQHSMNKPDPMAEAEDELDRIFDLHLDSEVSKGYHDLPDFVVESQNAHVKNLRKNLKAAINAYTTNKEQEAYKKGYIDGQIGAANGYDNQGNPIKYGVV